MGYKIVVIDDRKRDYIDSLTMEEFDKLMRNLRRLRASMMSKEYYKIVRYNMLELDMIMKNFDIRNKDIFIDLNRYMFNVVSALYTWMEYYERNYKEFFSSRKEKYYQEYFEYRCMYNLEIYMTCHEMAITQIDLENDQHEGHIFIEPRDLIKKGDLLQESFKQELAERYPNRKRIDVELLIKNFVQIFEDIHKDLYKEIILEAQKLLEEIKPYICVKNGKTLSTYIVDKETGKTEYALSSFIGMYVEKMINNKGIE